MAKYLRQSRAIRRRRAYRETLPRFLIFCEGEVTEARYFSFLGSGSRRRAVIKIAYVDSSPKRLVEHAKGYRKSDDYDPRHDTVWCVFDVDERLDIQDALIQARDNEIPVAVSNPCMELWALLHFEDCKAYVDRHDLPARLRVHMPGYDKELDCKSMLPAYEDAKRRARELDQMA